VQTAIATVCLAGTLNEKLEATAAARFKGVEIFESDMLSFDGTPAQVGRRIRDLGLEAVTFQPFRDFEGLPEPQRAKAFSRAERKFDLMQELGCDLLMVCSNVSPDALGGVDRAAADFRALGERAATRGLRVAFEALAWGRHVNDYRDAWEVVRRADHPSVGLVLDSFHVLARGTDLAALRAIPRDRIFLVQAADAPKLDMDYLSWSRHYRCFPGQGELPIGAFMDALQATGFDGLLSLEIFNDSFRAGSARSVASARCFSCSTSCGAAPGCRSPACRACRHGRTAAASTSSSSPWTRWQGRISRRHSPGSASPRPACTGRRRLRAGARAASISW
jgi:4-hydroxyphenylpyruvate dioxygenase